MKKDQPGQEPPLLNYSTIREIYRHIIVEPSPEHSMLEAMDFEQRIAYLKAKGEEAEKNFDKIFDDLTRLVLSVDPLVLLSSLSFHGLTSFDGHDREWVEESPLLQHHVELLQMMVLQHTPDVFRPVSSTARRVDILEQVKQLAQWISEAFHDRNYKDLDASDPDTVRARRRVVSGVRAETQMVRNWGNLPQVIRLLDELFAPLDDLIEGESGVRVTHLLKMYVALSEVIGNRIIEYAKKLNSIVLAGDLCSAAIAFNDAFPSFDVDRDEFVSVWSAYPECLDNAKQSLIAAAIPALPRVYTLTLSDFTSAYPEEIEPGRLRRVLESWSLTPGELAGCEVDKIMLRNPVWERPIIRLGEDRFFWPVPGMFLSFCFQMLNRFICSATTLKEKYEKRRAGFLESKVERLFREAFPMAQVTKGSMWRDPASGKLYENDLVVRLGNFLIIVEAKSHKVTDRARAGYTDRLGATVEKLIVEPSEQATRFADYLLNNPKQHKFRTKGKPVIVDSTGVTKAVLVNITLESLGTFNTHSPSLRSAEFIQKDIPIVPTMTVADLDTVFSILEGPCERLHYLISRAKFEKDEVYVADEMDLLGVYLNTGLNLSHAREAVWPDLETGKLVVPCFSRESKNLNPYLQSELTGQKIDKPRRQLTDWWRSLVKFVEDKRAPKWVEAGCFLLGVTLEEQIALEQLFAPVLRTVKRAPSVFMCDNAIIERTGYRGRMDAVALLAYKDLEPEKVVEMIRNSIRIGLGKSETGIVLAIGVDVNRKGVPCTVMFYYDANQSVST